MVGAQTNPLIGTLLGKDYRVIEQIGRGGMAVVYLVEHQTLQKRFAAKVLSEEHAASEEARARFEQEAHAASQLDHENIVTISDFGTTADQRPFFVMELLRGRTLDMRLEEGPMSLEEVVAVSVPVARALAHAHAESIIHRDVKPENVFLVQRSQGRWTVKVLDFGIAKVAINPRLTKMGQALGSPMFMAPEACRGDDVDQRADIYSFGILLYLMLTGRVPFEDESLLKVLQMQVTAPLPSPRQFNPALTEAIEAVVTRALAKNPDDRYPTMDALLFDLQAAMPEGADTMLIQAQVGTSLHDTPFPNSLRLSSQRLMVGEHDAATQLRRMSSMQVLPPAPRKSQRKLMWTIGIIGVLVVAGICGYGWYLQQQKAPAVAAAPVGQSPAAQQPTAAPPAAAAVATVDHPRVVGPPEPTGEGSGEGSSEPPPRVVGPPVVDEPIAVAIEPPVKPGAKKPAAAPKKPAPPKLVATSKVAVKTPLDTGSAAKAGSGSAAKAGSGSAAKAGSGSATVAVVTAPPVVEKPAPTGSATPAVTPPVVTPPKPAVTPPPANVGSLDATPSISSLEINGPLPSSVVRRAVERTLPALRTCYRAAAKAAGQTPALTMSLNFEIDENSTASSVSASGANLGSLAGCVRGAIGRVQTQQAPDVGTVHVAVGIKFQPL